MRYVQINRVHAGMILGKTLYGKGGELLLVEDSIIKDEYIHRMEALGIAGVYVKDEFSAEIEIPDVVTPRLKMKAIKTLKCLFLESDKGEVRIGKAYEDLRETLSEIVEELIHNQSVQINLMDIKLYNEYTYYHSINVGIISVVTGCGLNLSKEELLDLLLSGVLHDIGKRFVSNDILNKKGRLSAEEFEEIKGHSALGYCYIKENFDVSPKAYVGILQHHERYDGNGYPHKKSGKEISKFGRILAVADVYDALISKRPYHEPILPSDALEYIMANSGTQFDPKVVKAFTNKVATYPLGTEVELSNGQKGIVALNYIDFNLRPKIKIYGNSQEPVYVDLKNDKNARNITITKVGGMISIA